MNLSRVAIKQLTLSDLSFFAVHLKRSKQKAINLNADVFIDRFYPGLEGLADEFLFRLSIIGPHGRPPYVLTRKAVRSAGSKNWRLDGEFIYDPPGEGGRFDGLQEGDYAILAFDGSTRPEAVTLVLVSAAEDASLHTGIGTRFSFSGKQTMAVAAQAELSILLETTRAAYTAGHPLETLLLPDSVEEAVFGSAEVQERTAKTDGRGVAVSPQTMRQQLRAAEDTGQQGEETFNQWLESSGHGEDDYEWVSRTHARAAYDFHVSTPKWPGASGEAFVDVKATRGAFESPVHMSMAEIRWAAGHENHRIARIHALGTDKPRLSMLKGVHETARTIIETVVKVLPKGVSIDSFEIDVATLTEEFSQELAPPGD